MTTDPLDSQITNASALIALVLVFVFAYFSALFPLLEDARHRPKPPAIDDRNALLARLLKLPVSRLRIGRCCRAGPASSCSAHVAYPQLKSLEPL